MAASAKALVDLRMMVEIRHAEEALQKVGVRLELKQEIKTDESNVEQFGVMGVRDLS